MTVGATAEDYNAAAADFTRNGYECWMWDYPGFGKSTGEFSEQKLYDYALVLYKLARSRWAPSQIILYGRSIGTGIAAQLEETYPQTNRDRKIQVLSELQLRVKQSPIYVAIAVMQLLLALCVNNASP